MHFAYFKNTILDQRFCQESMHFSTECNGILEIVYLGKFVMQYARSMTTYALYFILLF